MLPTMLSNVWVNLEELLRRGGPVMWPLLAMSVVALTLVLERCWFFMRTNGYGRRRRVQQLGRLLRSGQRREAGALAERDASVYGDVVTQLLTEADASPTSPPSEAAAIDALEAQRHRLERFLPTLSTIITAAPMLGILGTVLGIIASFEILGAQTAHADPRSVSQGIAEALLTTAVGLVIAVVTLFPYNAFRAQVDRTLSQLESLAEAARQVRDNDLAPVSPASADKPQGPTDTPPLADE
ncbi:MotA/TolQ/ExbB proton channel family protein [Phycisphaerales bacterium AB-hyl4]|uniref:MotA/TolQ/ExbB proton channel family protein n=1 Tax=Natronomicrosphaera hydrolytica TaxID=3242702 RepID=A0ABV4U485_9BACT